MDKEEIRKKLTIHLHEDWNKFFEKDKDNIVDFFIEDFLKTD